MRLQAKWCAYAPNNQPSRRCGSRVIGLAEFSAVWAYIPN
jgi:hypothetical protein